MFHFYCNPFCNNGSDLQKSFEFRIFLASIPFLPDVSSRECTTVVILFLEI